MTVISLELNELNMHMVRDYIERGSLPELAKLIDRHGLTETASEEVYENIEPWIQWVTAHTGQEYPEHRIFRLGDIRDRGIDQIWEMLERQGISVGAVSPMNAENRCEDAAFFLPDPWVGGKVKGPWALHQLYDAVVQAVNDNAQSKLTAITALKLMIGFTTYARFGSLRSYAQLLTAVSRKRAWAKAMILDRLLADVFVKEMRKTKPQFSSLFLNAAAHIQHHYMFSSAVYSGPFQNPNWYVHPRADPILDVYQLYDNIIGDLRRAIPSARLIVATGLHQVPYGELTYYWRLKEHAKFLGSLGIPYNSVETRMSRDFVVTCNNCEDASEAQCRLEMLTSLDNVPLFSVDNRGSDLFVTLSWPHDIPADFEYRFGNEVRHGLAEAVAFVAIKNGEHDGVGYLIDTGLPCSAERVRLSELPQRFARACGVPLGV